jgi:hypothetical protein
VSALGKRRRRTPPLQLLDFGSQLFDDALLVKYDLDQFVATQRVKAFHIPECITLRCVSMPFKLSEFACVLDFTNR